MIVMMFEPVKPKRVSEYIVEQIEKAIREGKLLPNTKLPSERELSKIFEVSRSSVREALSILQGKGLVSINHGEGAFVRPLTESLNIELNKTFAEDPLLIWDLVEIRKTIELWAVRKACKVATDEDLEVIKEAFYDLYEDFKRNIISEQTDAEFHFSIVKATKNAVLIHMMNSIFKLLKEATNMGREYQIESNRITYSDLFNQHKKIYEALLERDAEKAYASMKTHLSYINEGFKHYLIKRYRKIR